MAASVCTRSGHNIVSEDHSNHNIENNSRPGLLNKSYEEDKLFPVLRGTTLLCLSCSVSYSLYSVC